MQLLSTAVHEQVQGEGILTEPVVKCAQKYDILKLQYPNKELFNSGCLWVTKYKPVHTIHHNSVYLHAHHYLRNAELASTALSLRSHREKKKFHI